MEKREQDILKTIEEKTKEVKVPKSLMPEQIESSLEEKGKKSGMKNKRIYRAGGLLAACLVLAVGIKIAGDKGINFGSSEKGTEEIAQEAADAGGTGVKEEQTLDKSESQKTNDDGEDDYKKIYSYIEAKIDMQKNEEAKYFDMGTETAEALSSGGAERESGVKDTAVSSAEDMKSADSSYSETNVRQEGVDEGDIVKTDGRYLYVLKENGKQISIVDTKGSLKKVGEIKAEKDRRIQEFYLSSEENKLVYIAGIYETKTPVQEETTKEIYDEDYIFLGNEEGMKEKTEAVTCDIKDPKKPEKLGNVTQSGSYSSSRMAGGYLYLFSNYNVGNQIDGHQPRTFIPMVNDSLIREKDISLPPFKCGSMYEVVTAVSIQKPSETADSKAIFTDGGELYVSNDNIYYYETKWNDKGEAEKTVIRRIGYKDGKLTSAVQGSIKGYINDSFSIDEYKGNLRIVATVGDTNSVYVLNEKLKTIGSIKKLAKDERVYSARFFGDTGYFVTFRETDPLFSVDLSDPYKPKILGKLKIPGFSDYLHFYGKDKLLGIGMNVDENAQITDGVKLSMFDISDNTDVKEEHKLVLKNVYSTEVSYDYKAALINADRNLIGLAGNTEGGERYYLFSYDEKTGFKCNMSEEINGRSGRAARGLYIEDTLYVVSGNVIEAYSLKDYKKTEDLIL
ncbi:MAG: hypothetical protein HFH03_04380 [Dorea sp.]|jgi:uncharacterized secreted protein with C-terminal beta-propeller domain|nr:hypothetical protein [Dorea sp.]